jgi:hypothetical protein
MSLLDFRSLYQFEAKDYNPMHSIFGRVTQAHRPMESRFIQTCGPVESRFSQTLARPVKPRFIKARDMESRNATVCATWADLG